VNGEESVSSIKTKIIDLLINQKRYVPQSCDLVFKGNILEDYQKMNEFKLLDNDHCMLLYKLDPNLPEIASPPKSQPKPVEEPVSADHPEFELSEHQQLSVDEEGEYDEGEFTSDVNGMSDDQGDLESIVALLQGIQQGVEAEAAGNNNPIISPPTSTEVQPPEANGNQPAINQPAVVPETVNTNNSGQPAVPDQITVPAQPTVPQPEVNANVNPPMAVRITFSHLIRLIPLPEVELQTLRSMGFPEWRCRKALLLNYFDADAALEWLLLHSSDPHADDQFTEEEAAQIIADISNLHYEPEEQHSNLEAQIAECVKNNKCTFTVTKREFAPQKWYYCYTCGLVDSEGVCESCAAVCHKNHKLSAIKSSKKFYCDCGAGAYNCKCNTE